MSQVKLSVTLVHWTSPHPGTQPRVRENGKFEIKPELKIRAFTISENFPSFSHSKPTTDTCSKLTCEQTSFFQREE